MARVEGIDPACFIPHASGVQKGPQDAGPRSHAAKDRRPRAARVLSKRPGRMAPRTKAAVTQRQRMLLTLRTATRVGCPF